MTNPSMSSGDFNGKKDHPPDTSGVFKEHKAALDELKEYIELRKNSLEEEIEGRLHEAVRNANDCLERIHETLEPKFEKTVLRKMEDIDLKVKAWTDDCRDRLSGEIKRESEALASEMNISLKTQMCEKLESLAGELEKTANAKLESELNSRLKHIRKGQTILVVLTVTLLGGLSLIVLLT